MQTCRVMSASSSSLPMFQTCSVQCLPLLHIHIHIFSVPILPTLLVQWGHGILPGPPHHLLSDYSHLVKRSDPYSQNTTPTTPLVFSTFFKCAQWWTLLVFFPTVFFLANRAYHQLCSHDTGPSPR